MAPFWRKFPLPQTWRLRLELRSLSRFYGRLRSKAKTEQERQDLLGEMFSQTDPLEEELKAIFTHRLLKKASRLHVPVPDSQIDDQTGRGENWICGYTGKYYLTPKGVSKVREEIRKEQKARWERWENLRAWLTLIFSLIGAAAGLIAALKKN